MKLLLSASRLLIRAALIIGLVGLLAIGSAYLEPVKARRALRHAKNQIGLLLAGQRERQSRIRDYEPIVLHGARPRTAQSFADSKDMPIRLLDMEFGGNSSPSPRKVSVFLDGQERSAIVGVVPFNFSYNLHVPNDGYLLFGLNQEGWDSSTGELNFTVHVSNKGRKDRLYQMRLPSSLKDWKDETIDLRAFAGQEVKLQFSVSLQDHIASLPNSNEKSVRAYWSNLFLGSRATWSKKPNIFLILIDTVRPDHLSCYGYERPTSPNIDQLAAKGVRFENAFSAAPWTNPSILSLFTGLYPSDAWEPKPHREAIKWSLPQSVDTMAEILSVNGYFTIAASDHPGIGSRLFGQGFDIYAHLYYSDGPYRGWRETDAEKVLKQLHALLETRSESGLLAYIHLIYPHQPYEPPAPYDNYFGRGALTIKRKNKGAVINMYDGEIKRTDDIIGYLLADIKRSNLYDDSIIIILSDHGEGFWEHGLWEHGNSLYNELLHIPLIFHAPGRIPQGKNIAQLVRNTDILPTILDLLGIKYDNQSYRGSSLLSLMRGANEKSKRPAFSEFPHSRIVLGRAIQSLTEKLIDPTKNHKPLKYFDIAKDPEELNNLSAAESRRVSGLIEIMDDISRSAYGRRTTHPADVVEPSEDTIKKLKSLGYIQ